MGGFDLEYYYDPNHVNVWTKKHFRTLLDKVGLEVVKEDHIIYGSTFLCKRNDSLMTKERKLEDPTKIKDWACKLKQAFVSFNESKYKDAIDLWPDFPTAWVNYVEHNRKELAEIGWPEFKLKYIDAALRACPDNVDIMTMATDYAMRAKQWKEAVNLCEEALSMKPENPVCLNQLCNIMRELALSSGDPKEKIHFFNQARNVAKHLRAVSAQHFNEASDLIFAFAAELPLNHGEIKQKLGPLANKGEQHEQRLI
jgi:tetratricopeptide (TPR) repeat protein